MKIVLSVLALALLVVTVTHAQGPQSPEWRIIKAAPEEGLARDHKDYIPKEFGRLVSAETIRTRQQSGAGDSWLWFEGNDGTVRVVRLTLSGNNNGVWTLVTVFPRR